MPEAHGVGLGNFNLVSEDLPLSEIVAADLDAGVAFVPAKFKAKNKVGGLAAAPDEPVFFFGGSRTPDLAVTDFPGPGLPSQPVRSLSLKMETNPGSSSAAWRSTGVSA